MSNGHEALSLEHQDVKAYFSRGEILHFLVDTLRDYMELEHIHLEPTEVRQDDLIHLSDSRKTVVVPARKRVLQEARKRFMWLKRERCIDPTWLHLEEASIEAQLVTEALENAVRPKDIENEVVTSLMSRVQVVEHITSILRRIIRDSKVDLARPLTTPQRKVLIENGLFFLDLLLSKRRIPGDFFKRGIAEKIAFISECIDHVVNI